MIYNIADSMTMKTILRCIFWSSISIVVIFFVFRIAPTAYAATYIVNSNVNAVDGTCVDPYVDSASDCTLLDAIAAANANSGADIISFAMDSSFADDGDGQWTIVVSATNTITGPVEITGIAVWDTDDNRPGIKLVASGSVNALSFSTGSDASEVKAIEISGGASPVTITAPSIIIGTDCDGSNDSIERNVLYSGTTQQIYICI